DQILEDPDLSLWALVRSIQPGQRGAWNARTSAPFEATPLGRAIRSRLTDGRDLRTYASVAANCGADVRALPTMVLAEGYWRPALGSWDPAAVWPVVGGALGPPDEGPGLGPAPGAQKVSQPHRLGLPPLFPKAPARYLHALMERAVGSRKS